MPQTSCHRNSRRTIKRPVHTICGRAILVPACRAHTHREHVIYVKTQVRAPKWTLPVGKVDEIHNISLATRSGAEVSDQLKYFAERLPATFIYAGIDVAAQGLFAGTRGRQIAGRFTMIPAEPFDYGTSEQRDTWRALIGTLENLLRLHQHTPGTLLGLDEYLYQRSNGMIGTLSQLIRGAAILAIEDGTEHLTQTLLDSVPVDYAAERAQPTPRQRNRVRQHGNPAG